MRRLSVGIIVEALHSSGGVERRTLELVHGLAAAGHDVHVYANRWARDITNGASRLHFMPILRLSKPMKPRSFAWACSALVSRKHDVIHTQARVFRYDVATLGVGCHGAYMDAMGIDLDSAPDRAFHHAVLDIERTMFDPRKFAEGARIITNSNMCKGEIIERYSVPEASISVVHNGVDHKDFSPERRQSLRADSRAQLGIRPDEVAVMLVGPGFQRKGLDTLIEALGHLRGRADRVKLVIVGRGDRDSFNKLAAEMGIGDRLIWTGRADSADIARYYAAADVFALPTRYDPFANSTMEALASRLPVVTSTANGVSEILRDETDAMIVRPGDSKGLSERLLALVDDLGLRDRIGSAGHAAVQPYTWQMTTEKTMDVYALLPKTGARHGD